MASKYYKAKVLTRADGILDTCLIARRGYKWGSKRSDGSEILAFILENGTPEENVDKALLYMKNAFRKATCYKGPEAEYRDRPGTRYPTLIVEFK